MRTQEKNVNFEKFGKRIQNPMPFLLIPDLYIIKVYQNEKYNSSFVVLFHFIGAYSAESGKE